LKYTENLEDISLKKNMKIILDKSKSRIFYIVCLTKCHKVKEGATLLLKLTKSQVPDQDQVQVLDKA